MRATQQTRDPDRQQLEAELAARVEALFGRCPTLYGFSLQPGDLGDAGVMDLTCFPTPSRENSEAILSAVAQMLTELEEEQPEAAELLRGRTFARAIH